MPPPGHQYRDNAATTNPFEEHKLRVSEYTAQEIATLQSRLDKQLGPEYISTRPGAGGGKVHYLAAEKVINLANEVFGFNGWCSAIQNVQIDFVDENAQSGKITLGLSTIVRVTLRDGTYHEDIGYGHIENCKGKAAAFEKAKKEAATDAMKRALRNFGNVLGNCLYDKDYLSKVTKLKVAPSRWDADNLHRHADYAPIKRESIADSEARHAAPQETGKGAPRQISNQSGASFGSMEFEEDFGGNPFDETDVTHPDEVRLDETPAKRADNATRHGGQQRQGVPRMHSMPQIRPPNIQPPPPIQNPQQIQRPQGPPRTPNNAPQGQQAQVHPQQAVAKQPQQDAAAATSIQHRPDVNGQRSNPSSATANDSPINVQQPRQPPRPAPNQANGEEQEEHGFTAPRMPPPGNPEGFVTGRSVELLSQPPGARPANASLAFNPHAETPSIRRTQGINPGKSAPVTRSAITATGGQNGHSAPTAQPPGPAPQQQVSANGMNGATTPVRTNFVNPGADPNRRIGMPPPAAAHGVQTRGPYRPPTSNLKRPPLTDVSNLQQMDGADETKKAKVDHAQAPSVVADEATTAASGP